MDNEFFVKYNFNPFQFAANERASRHFHDMMARYFNECSNVFDIGCGKGEFLRALKRAGKKGFGIDAFDEAVQECMSNGLQAEKWDVHEYISGSRKRLSLFDGIYCAHVIEHFTPERVFELFKLLFDATERGTRLVIVTPNYDDVTVSGSGFWLDLTHVRPYPGLLVQRMLECIGFREVGYKAIYGLGISKSILKNYLVQKMRFGDRIYKPNLVISAIR